MAKSSVTKNPPVITARYSGKCPNLGNRIDLTLYADGSVKIERQPYTRQQVSRYDGRTMIETRTFPVLIEPQELHRWLIDSLAKQT